MKKQLFTLAVLLVCGATNLVFGTTLQVTSAQVLNGGNVIGINFNNGLSPSSATDTANYAVSGGYTVTGAVLLSGNETVGLELSAGVGEGITSSGVTVTINNVTDTNSDVIAANTTAPVTLLAMSEWDMEGAPPTTPTVAVPVSSSELDVTANDGDIWGGADGGNFIYTAMTNDFDIRVQVTAFDTTQTGCRAGLWVRQAATDPSSPNMCGPYIFPPVRSPSYWSVTVRSSEAGSTSEPWYYSISPVPPNVWLRLQRIELTNYYLFYSTDGSNWENSSINSPQYLGMDLTNPIYVGLVTSSGQSHVHYANFGPFAYTNAGIQITRQPTNAFFSEGDTVTLSVGGQVTNAPAGAQAELQYQWQLNGTNIAGATASSYTTVPLSPAAAGSQYQAVLTLYGSATNVSNPATLTVNPNPGLVEVVSAQVLNGGNVIGINFSDGLDSTTATNIANYNVSAGYTVTGAVLLRDGETVGLELSAPVGGGITNSGVTVTINNVTDIYSNVIAANSTAPVTLLAMSEWDMEGAPPTTPTVAVPVSSSELDVTANDGDIWGGADGGNFIYTAMTNDFDIRVQVTAFDTTQTGCRAGLWVRQAATDPSSPNMCGPYIFPPVRSPSYWSVTVRSSEAGSTSEPWYYSISPVPPNVWLRLQRIELTNYYLFYSTDGSNWENSSINSPQYLGMDLTNPIYVGLVTSSGQSHVHYANFGPFAYTNAGIQITLQPNNVTVSAGYTATFSASGHVTNAPPGAQSELQYQWQLNGTNIAGATASSYTTLPLGPDANGNDYQVVLTLYGSATNTSRVAMLTVNPNPQPVQVVSSSVTTSDGSGIVSITYSALVTPATATNTANYSVSGGASVTGAFLEDDGKTVGLTLSGPLNNGGTVTINNVSDYADNSVPPNTVITPANFGYMGDDINASSTLFPIDGNGLNVTAVALGVGGIDDYFNFAYEPVTGDFDLEVQIDAFSAVSGSAQAGLMIRDEVDDDGGLNFFTFVNPPATGDWNVSTRLTSTFDNTVSAFSTPVSESLPNGWVRLRRNGSVVTGYYGTDGVNWLNSFSADLPSGYPTTALVGLATSSGSYGDSASVDYRNLGAFAYSNASITITQQPQGTNAPPGQLVTLSVEVLASNAPQNELFYEWRYNGTNIAGSFNNTLTLPPLTFANSGSYDVVVTLPGASITSQVAIIEATGVATNQPHVVSATILNQGNTIAVVFDTPLDINSATNPANYELTDGLSATNATLEGNYTTVILDLNGNLSGDSLGLTINNVDSFAGIPIAANTMSSVNVLPLTSVNIGYLYEPGIDALAGPNTYDVTLTSADIWGDADSLNFLCEQVSGDFDVRVQISQFDYPGDLMRVGLMARQTFDPGSVNLDVALYPPDHEYFAETHRLVAGGATAQTYAVGITPPTLPNAWLRMQRFNGTNFNMWYSTDGTNWTLPYSIVVPLVDPIYLGMATATADYNNSPSQQGFTEYTNFSSPAPPFLVSATFPGTNIVGSPITILLDDGTTYSVNTASIMVTLNGVSITPTISKTGNITTITYNTTAALNLGSNANTLTVVFADNESTPLVQTNTFTFTVVSGIAPPPPGVIRNQYSLNATNSVVVLEAVDYNLASPSTDGVSPTHNWVFTANPLNISPGFEGWSGPFADTNFSSAGVMEVQPISGAPDFKNATGDLTGAGLQFAVNFPSPGTFYLWVRGIADSADSPSGNPTSPPGASVDDSVQFGLDGRFAVAIGNGSAFPLGAGFTWAGGNGSVVPNNVIGGSDAIGVGTAGLHTVNVWMRETGFDLDKILLTTNAIYVPSDVGPAESAPMMPLSAYSLSATNNVISIEAVDYTANNSPNSLQDGSPASVHSWVFTTAPINLQPGFEGWSGAFADTNFSSSGVMEAQPDVGANEGSVITTGPHLDYAVNFPAAGTYYVWLRGIADGPNTATGGSSGGLSDNDSVQIGLDNALTTVIGNGSAFPLGAGFAWAGGSGAIVPNNVIGGSDGIVVANAGLHLLNVWMREDGFDFDKIVLTTNANYVPTDVGPAESPVTPAVVAISGSSANITLTWLPGLRLQSSLNVAGPYADVPGATSPYVVVPTGGQRFYRISGNN